jgi:hypothetical protein
MAVPQPRLKLCKGDVAMVRQRRTNSGSFATLAAIFDLHQHTAVQFMLNILQ